MYNRLTKKQLINDINIFFLKQGLECSIDITRISKKKLIEIMIENDIPHINKEQLKLEIEETEKYNYYLEIIHYNFMKFKNMNIDDIKNIHNNHMNSDDLNKIIIDNNLVMNGHFKETSELINDLIIAMNKYYNSTNTKNTIEYKTIPDIIKNLNLL
jgi:hypothetical protein